jgi:hypothetical protein
VASETSVWSQRLAWLVMSRAGVVLGWIVAMMEILRETPEFWTNAGGYPVWMRATAREAFVPLVLLSLCNLAGLVWLLLTLPARSWAEVKQQLSWVAGVVVLLLFTVAVGIWDE